MKNCYVHHTGDNSGRKYTNKYMGISVPGNNTGIVISDNVVAYSGDTGISIGTWSSGGNTAQAQVLRNTVTYAGYDTAAAQITDVEACYDASAGMGIANNGAGCTVSYNTISNSWENAIGAYGFGAASTYSYNDLTATYPVARLSGRRS